ncbi:hypothetical protein WBG78_04990 [Chryseolinea sp. T2]|uniref:hypothetical protein n=1 Tax=Chryseolinea sp. T2 TaxID=3129255 RepID=UPI00307844B7
MDPYLQALFSAVVSTLTTFITLILTGYFTKKAQNRADIEDTAKITELQESVRHQFETLNAKVDLVNQNKLSLADEERKAIYGVNETIYELVMFLNTFMASPKYALNPTTELMTEYSGNV